MRISLILAAALLVSVSPAAQAASGPTFGTAQCRPTFPCADPANPETMARMEQKAFSVAKSCVRKQFKRIKGSRLFKESYGLTSDLCMRAEKQKAGDTGLAMTPDCCVKPVLGKKGQCYVRCNLVGLR